MILDDLDRISGYSTPSVLGGLLTMLNYRGPLNPTWLDAVHSREGNILYPASLYFLKNSAYFIATRTQARWVWLMDWVGVAYILDPGQMGVAYFWGFCVNLRFGILFISS